MSRVKRLKVNQGDSLRTLALRELGDATRWTELARLNDLRLPFIIESYRPADRMPHTLIWGDDVLVPWASHGGDVPTPLSNFGTDLALPHGQLAVTATGDLLLLTGRDNVVQAIAHRIKCLRGEMDYHPRYGCQVTLALGLPTRPFASMMASTWVHEALREETRIAAIDGVRAEVEGDTIRVAAAVTLVGDNSSIDANLVLNP